MPRSRADITHARVSRAYIGVDAQPGCTLTLTESRVDSCVYDGVRMQHAVGTVVLDSFTYNGVNGIEFDTPGYPYMAAVSDNYISSTGFAGIRAVGPGSGFALYSVNHNTIVSPAGISAAAYGIYLYGAISTMTLSGNRVSGFHTAGLYMKESSLPSNYDTLIGNAAFNLQCAGSSPTVRNAYMDVSHVGVLADNTSQPDLGRFDSYGNNQILMGNLVWVENLNTDSVQARYNWWGTDRPDWYPGKFVGPVAYNPWLWTPPDGGQSAGSVTAQTSWLGECRPSPVRRTATINYSISSRGNVSLQMLDMAGRVVRDLAAGVQEPGQYSVAWDGRDSKGRTVAKAVYFYRLVAPGFTDTKKAVVVR
jgi:hypothetical protein